ncbi:hypothetical protein F443_19513 [Phytophthora nicotianae P1569]|uniref:Uncharacterized protein n=1 Tax=Phytophthora nicotianae P1569 TaxID=1317065 RepID=V9E4K1_PHYNI|nr:hypothetical protein F443_19513 [Phytophthora nicotianae P1569]
MKNQRRMTRKVRPRHIQRLPLHLLAVYSMMTAMRSQAC